MPIAAPRSHRGLRLASRATRRGEVGESRDRTRGPPHRHHRGFEGPVNLPQCFAVRAAALAVVSFSYVPAPVWVTGTGPPAGRGPRDHSGTGVASRPTEPSKPASSSGLHTLTEASSRSATNFSSCLPGG